MFNLYLALLLAWKSIQHHKLVSLASIAGIAIGMSVVSSILIIDHNTENQQVQTESLSEFETKLAHRQHIEFPITNVSFQKKNQQTTDTVSKLPTQKRETTIASNQQTQAKGEEDYQTMRLAIRMASMFTFFIGAIIVFYTMRFSVAIRLKEFALLICLGETQKNVALSLCLESIILGIFGSMTGLLTALPMSRYLLDMGISTTGRTPMATFSLPELELTAIFMISLLVVLVGVIAPVRTLFKFRLSEILQPRFVETDINQHSFEHRGLSWLISPLLFASYIVIRPFLEHWLSVIYFFFLEALFIIVFTWITLSLTRPLLRLSIHIIELLIKPVLALESLLSIRRIRLTSQKFVFSIFGVILVFSLLNSLHALTRSLKEEIRVWSDEALTDNYYYKIRKQRNINDAYILGVEKRYKLNITRYSDVTKGSFPIRLAHNFDINRLRNQQNKNSFELNHVILSKTLARRFSLETGDHIILHTNANNYPFEILEITDAYGTFAKDAQYIDLKSFALFNHLHPLFMDNLALTIGNKLITASANKDKPILSGRQERSLQPYYDLYKSGYSLKQWQINEIDRDFLIFDYILLMTLFLTCIGIVNTLLIQIHQRHRELSILKSLGISRFQLFRLLMTEGLIIGLIGAALSLLLGTALGYVCIAFLDQFTLFEYHYNWSFQSSLSITLFAVLTCCLSAIYPALAANKISTAESLHYE